MIATCSYWASCPRFGTWLQPPLLWYHRATSLAFSIWSTIIRQRHPCQGCLLVPSQALHNYPANRYEHLHGPHPHTPKRYRWVLIYPWATPDLFFPIGITDEHRSRPYLHSLQPLCSSLDALLPRTLLHVLLVFCKPYTLCLQLEIPAGCHRRWL